MQVQTNNKHADRQTRTAFVITDMKLAYGQADLVPAFIKAYITPVHRDEAYIEQSHRQAD